MILLLAAHLQGPQLGDFPYFGRFLEHGKMKMKDHTHLPSSSAGSRPITELQTQHIPMNNNT